MRLVWSAGTCRRPPAAAASFNKLDAQLDLISRSPLGHFKTGYCAPRRAGRAESNMKESIATRPGPVSKFETILAAGI
ncbi:hypothetical protein IE81DRAFT_12256 [Ceraceosorus guamensis]|uniref:Uncharacterized protein n=1 Tax=Ceraceosorus guamensis TaxID=1522189 RepID=A0A316W686_9BASI|nr:hypothetical protein IE81DRAFT_12256 [Ceraceosorus guamensis]PWN44608.1 hypothetical protein IE81DRAFT_12256 [Ceraceosorus guamensis]